MCVQKTKLETRSSKRTTHAHFFVRVLRLSPSSWHCGTFVILSAGLGSIAFVSVAKQPQQHMLSLCFLCKAQNWGKISFCVRRLFFRSFSAQWHAPGHVCVWPSLSPLTQSPTQQMPSSLLLCETEPKSVYYPGKISTIIRTSLSCTPTNAGRPWKQVQP